MARMRKQMSSTNGDAIDLVIKQWGVERPDLDVSPVAVIGRISRVSRAFERTIGRTLETFGLNSAGFYVLAALRRSGPPFSMSPTELFSSLLVSGGTMTHRIDRLEAAGLVTRSADPTDGRSTRVTLTDRGKALIEQVMEVHNRNEHALLAVLTPSERERLATLLRKLLASS